MEKVRFTITGVGHYYGTGIFAPGAKVRLIKEPENAYDREAIRVEVKGLGKVGYVANSFYTVEGECMSAGRLYDRIGQEARGKVLFVLSEAVICKVCKNSLRGAEDPQQPLKND